MPGTLCKASLSALLRSTAACRAAGTSKAKANTQVSRPRTTKA
jgi:hypothetical protein